MQDKRQWAATRLDSLRRTIMLEPRGHADLGGAVLTEPVTPGADAGVLFMDGRGFPSLSGHGLMAVSAVAVARGLVLPRQPHRLVFDTAAGPVRVEYGLGDLSGGSRFRVSGVPSFVLHPGVECSIPGRRLRADVAYGGAFYAIVDAESAGVPVDGAYLGALRGTGVLVAAAVESALTIEHPVAGMPGGLAGVVFTAPPRVDGAALRSAVVRVHGAVERSPSGTATAAMMAVLDAMGLLIERVPFVHESLIGQTFEGQVVGHTVVHGLEAILPDVTGEAHITGEHLFLADAADPFRAGFQLS